LARVVALIPDLLFGSKVQSALEVAGHEVELVGPERVDGLLTTAQLLIVDLTDPDLDGAALVSALNEESQLQGTSTLGFFAHVDIEVRKRAQASGFDLVVPRSRMAREGAQLVAQLLAGAAPETSA
jgi:CheY-like chemotaxis protein